MKIFWTYFCIFLVITILTQLFLFYSGDELYTLDIKMVLLQLTIIFFTALIVSYMLRKPKNIYAKKTN